MPRILNGEEVLEMACQIERDGRAFYERAAKLQPEGPAKELLEELAAMERDHEAVFEAMKSKVLGSKGLATGHEDVARYLDAAVSGKIFPKAPTARLSAGVDMHTILNVALEREKDTVVFYSALRHAVPEDLQREKLEEIIRQEVGHVAMISAALHSLDD